MILIALMLSIAGCGALAFSMKRYAPQFGGRSPRKLVRVIARLIGAVILITALGACIGGWGWVYGSIGCWGVLTVGAGVVLIVVTARSGRTSKPRVPA